MTITAKFQGKCKACNGIIPKGSPIEWSKGAGARHIECTNTPEGIAKRDAARSQSAWNASRSPLMCPTCNANPISREYKRKGYQCDSCADRDEGKSFGMEW